MRSVEFMGEWTPLAHQREDVERLSVFPRIHMWNDLGTGKTCTVTWWLQNLWLREVIDEVIVIAPSMTTRDWTNTFAGATWPEELVEVIDCRPPNSQEIYDLITSGRRPPQARLRVMMTTFAGFAGLLAEKSNRKNIVKAAHPMMRHARGRKIGLVVDEAQGVALSSTAQGVAARQFATACRAVASVTATPIGRAEHMRLWGLTRLVRPDILTRLPVDMVPLKPGVMIPAGAPGSFEAFKYRFGYLHDPMQDKRGGVFSVTRAFVTDVDSKRIEQEILGPQARFTARRTQEECLDLPPKVFFTRSIPMSGRLKEMMDGLINDDRAVITAEHVVVPANILEERLRTLELTGGYLEGAPIHDLKLQLLKDTAEEIAEKFGDRAPFVVWASRTREIIACALTLSGMPTEEALHAAARISAGPQSEYTQMVRTCRAAKIGLLHGATSTADRDTIQDEWRRGEIKACVAHPGVAGAGLNWQFLRGSVYYSQPLGVIARSQSEARVHRQGLKHTAMYWDLTIEDGPDEAVVIAHRSQKSVEEALLDWMSERIYS